MHPTLERRITNLEGQSPDGERFSIIRVESVRTDGAPTNYTRASIDGTVHLRQHGESLKAFESRISRLTSAAKVGKTGPVMLFMTEAKEAAA